MRGKVQAGTRGTAAKLAGRWWHMEEFGKQRVVILFSKIVRKNHIPRIARTLALVAILIGLSLFRLWPECAAQNRLAAAEYDYYSLALTSISRCARDASKVRDIPQRVKLLLYAAKILPTSQHDEAMRLLYIALVDLKQ